MQQVQQQQPDCTWGELSLVLTDDCGITELNHTYFNKHQPTDVISFHYTPMPGTHTDHTGEVIVNVDCALREGPSHRGSSHELALYIAHGCHHLTGATDHTPTLRAAMRSQEDTWLASANQQGLLQELVSVDKKDPS